MTEHEQQLLIWAQGQCARQEYSRRQMYQRLAKRGASQEECNSILSALEDEDFINEQRFAKAFVHDKALFERWGRRKIAYKLRADHQIGESIINEALSQLNAEAELCLLEELLLAKLRSGDPLTPEAKLKLFRFAEQRGFTRAQIYTVLKQIGSNDDCDE